MAIRNEVKGGESYFELMYCTKNVPMLIVANLERTIKIGNM